MGLYIDCAYLDDIIAAQTIPVLGVTTNPTLQLEAQRRGQTYSPKEVAMHLLEQTNGIIFMQPSIYEIETAYQEAIEYIQLNPERVFPKIPMTQLGLVLAQRLTRQGYRFAFTTVTSVSQAYIAAMAGATHIIPFYNRLRRSGVDPIERISHMARVISSTPTRIMASSIKTTAEAAEALCAGAHDLTIPPHLLQSMVNDPESEEAIAHFQQDYQKVKNL